VGRLIRVALVVTLSVVSGCAPKSKTGEPGAEAVGIERTFERGPLKVVVRLTPEEPTIADSIQLSLEVTSDENYTVDMPSFGEKLEQFGITDFTESQPQLVEGNRTRTVRSYELEPFLSGEYVIPPMKFAFRSKGKESDDQGDHELDTEEIKLTVRSLLDETKAGLKIHDIEGPVSLERPSRARLWWTIGGAAAGLIFLVAPVIWLVMRRERKVYVPPPVPAHEIAFQELEKLVADDLPRKGQIKPFYQRISDILRRYIENRFGLHAPDQTTEEFLAEMQESPALPPVHQGRLKEFLQHCDLVKFAEHVPGTDEIQGTFDACKNFIIETQAQDVTVPQPPAPPVPAAP
jgi:hypothetical protein